MKNKHTKKDKKHSGVVGRVRETCINTIYIWYMGEEEKLQRGGGGWGMGAPTSNIESQITKQTSLRGVTSLY